MKDRVNLAILQAGAQLRANMIEQYASLGDQNGDTLARRYVFEVGSAIKLARGPNEASAILYAAADAISADLPIDDFRLPPALQGTPAASAAGNEKPSSRIGRAIKSILHALDSFVFGLFVGLWMGGLK